MGILDNVKVAMGYSKKQPEAPVQPTIKKKVLIVEDEDLLAEGLAIAIQKEGIDTIRASDGEMGLDMVTKLKPDLILLDLIMPRMDGKTLLRKIRELPEFKDLPVIVLSNAGNVDNIKETVTYSNAQEFLIKSSVEAQDIVNKIKTFLKA